MHQATFQRLMDVVLQGLQPEQALVYVDDVIVFTKGNLMAHLQRLDNVMSALQKAGLQVNLKKCQFVMHKLKYLGHIVSSDGIKPDPEKVAAIQGIKPPKNVHEVRSFLGLVGYYRRFILQFAHLAGPLEVLKHKDQSWVWGLAQQQAFEVLRSKLTESPVLTYPDWSKEFIIETDGSGEALAATLWQEDEQNIRRPIAYISRRLKDAETRYPACQFEALAAVWAVEKFEPYIWGRHFTLVTDATSVSQIKEVQGKSRLARWALALQEYDYTVMHRPGKQNPVNDALTRIQIESAQEEKGIVTPQHHKQLGSVMAVQVKRNTWIVAPVLPLELAGMIVSEQEKDAMFGPMRRYLKGDLKAFDHLTQDDGRMAVIKSDQFILIEDKLFYTALPLHDKKRSRQLRLCIPEGSVRTALLHCAHDDVKGGGHWGVQKTYRTVSKRYWWKTMYYDIHRWVTSCPACQAYATQKPHVALKTITAYYPNHMLPSTSGARLSPRRKATSSA